MRAALRALAPGAVVFLAAVGVLAWRPEQVGAIAEDYALVAYGAGLALAWVFHRSRAFIALGLLIWLDIAVDGDVLGHDLLTALGTVVVGLLGLLGLVRDRGVGSRVGVLQIFGASAIAAGAGVVFADPELVGAFASNRTMLPLGTIMWPGYPVATLVVAGLGALSVGYGVYRYGGPLERSFGWCVVLLMVAMHPQVTDDGSALFLMAAGLTLTVGMVETSYTMAYRDDLTGLPGRRALMQYLDGIQGTYTIAMVDVDHFKKFNDKHGHDVGDQVLKLVAGRLAEAPGGGKAYRYGGEEFTLIYPGRTRETAEPYLESVRHSVAESRFSIRSWKRPRSKPKDGGAGKKSRKGRDLSVTVSIGMADTTGKASGPEAILKKADEALYRAKKKGRNQVSK